MAILNPLDRTSQHHRDVGDGNLFREEAGLFAEASPNVGSHYPDAALRALQQLGQALPDFVGMLSGVPDSEHVFARLVIGQQSPGLHGGRGQTLHMKLAADHPVSMGESSVQVAAGVDGL